MKNEISAFTVVFILEKRKFSVLEPSSEKIFDDK